MGYSPRANRPERPLARIVRVLARIGLRTGGPCQVRPDHHDSIWDRLISARGIRAVAVWQNGGPAARGWCRINHRKRHLVILVGLWMAIAHLVFGFVLCLTIIGIPLGLGNFKLAAIAIAPLGKEIVPTTDPRAALGTISF